MSDDVRLHLIREAIEMLQRAASSPDDARSYTADLALREYQKLAEVWPHMRGIAANVKRGYDRNPPGVERGEVGAS